MRVAILAHEKFPDRAKTAIGILRYAEYDVVAVLDRDRPGERVHDHLKNVQDAPIVASIDDIDEFDALIIGIAPIGGGFDESWRSDVTGAIERGCDIIAGLHYQLQEDTELASLADTHDVELHDVREPPDDLSVSEGIAGDLDATIVLTVGTDCSVGKMTVTMELVEALRERGVSVCAIPTGQTGIMIEGWGIAVDRVISDFTAGAIERMLLERADEYDVLVVEGQGSITHPAYSGVTCSLLHGSMPDQLILCHEPGREVVHGYESFELLDLEAARDLYIELATPVAPTELVGVALNTRYLDEEEAISVIESVEVDLDVTCTDPVRYGADALAEVIG